MNTQNKQEYIKQFSTISDDDALNPNEVYYELYEDKIQLLSIYRGKRKYNSKSKENLLQYKDKNGFNNVKGFFDYLNQNKPKQFIYNGFISKSTKKRINKFLQSYINSLIWHNKNSKDKTYQLVFLTLTLSSKQLHSDNDIKRKIFNPFIDYLKRKNLIKYFFWRAEKQKNGNIHFHLIVDKYQDFEELKRLWNTFQNRLGYIDNYSKKMQKKYKNGFFYDVKMLEYSKLKNKRVQVNYKKQLARYNIGKKTNWTSPNSVDLKKLNPKKNIIGYLLKYMTKNPKKEKDETEDEYIKRIEPYKVEGRIWGASKEIKKLSVYQVHSDTTYFDDISNIVFNCDKIKVFSPVDNCIIFYFQTKQVKRDIQRKINSTKVIEFKNKHHQSVMSSLYELYPPPLNSFVYETLKNKNKVA